ncbi:MAG: hypothetical protein ACOZAO_02985 [Patescibacteria group bacterium]
MKVLILLTKIFILFSIAYWIIISIVNPTESIYFDIFGYLLAILPLTGLLLGIKTSTEWGGMGSAVGKSIMFISLSLLMWVLGQTAFLYYIQTTGDVPFPGLPDYFFVFIDPLYAISMLSIMKYSGVTDKLKKPSSYFLLFVIPLFAIYLNYQIFFGETAIFEELDASVIFDLIYTFGSTAIMILIVLTILLSIGKLGGKLRTAIYAIFLGIVLQYSGDIAYSIAELENLVSNGILADFIFFLSISCVIWGIIKFKEFSSGNNGST